MADMPRHLFPDWFTETVKKMLWEHEKNIFQQFFKQGGGGTIRVRDRKEHAVMAAFGESSSASTHVWSNNYSTDSTTATTSNSYVRLSSDLGTSIHVMDHSGMVTTPARMESILPAGISINQFGDTLKISSAFSGKVELPDGALMVFEKGNYKIEDKDAKITYKADRHRDFNKFVKGSDLLEDFINDLGKLGVTQSEFMNLPVQAFITWLIYKAAEHDQEPHQFRCMSCGRYTKPGLVFCDGDHLKRISNNGIS